MQKQMDEDYEIKVPNLVDMKITVTGMLFKLTENKIIEKLRRQNNFLNDNQMEVIKLFKYKRYGDA